MMRMFLHFIAALLLSIVATATPVALCDLLGDIKKAEVFVEIDAREEDAAARAFESILDCSKELDPFWREMGYLALNPGPGEDAGWVLLKEGTPRGQGCFLIRCGKRLPVMIVAPHVYDDAFTLEIGEYLALHRAVAVFARSTAQRAFKDKEGKTVDADLAHQHYSYLNSLTRAFARAFPKGRLIFLHGYATAKRETRAGRALEIILSSGDATPSLPLFDMKRNLETRLGVRAGIYPLDVLELGGTTCAQSKILANLWHDGFVHVEISRSLRERLVRDHQTLETFADCLLESLELPA